LILSDTVIEDDISPPEELFQEYFGLIEAACFRDLKALYDHLYKITDEPGIFSFGTQHIRRRLVSDDRALSCS